MSRILITGAAGFIGYYLATRLLARGDEVVGIDNLNAYYDVRLKIDRLSMLHKNLGFSFFEYNIEEHEEIEQLFATQRFDAVIHLAAQAGVRYSLENPHAYIQSNVTGFMNILEGCRNATGLKQLVFASSSSVYGASTRIPFSEHHTADHPVSLYAATKRANELMAHSYASIFGIPVTGLRFFTVYGPWGRPDMAYFSFTRSILKGEAIKVFNQGLMKRDFTYIDDITEGIVRVLERIPSPNVNWKSNNPDPATSSAPYRLYNIGNNKPVELMHLIRTIEDNLGKKAVIDMLPMQPGDVVTTFADVDDLMEDAGFKPDTSIEEGIGRFVAWYREYYGC